MCHFNCLFLAIAVTACSPDRDDDGVSPRDGDCDDRDGTLTPGIDEVCDGVDQDCDGQVDEEPTDGTEYFLDADGDGRGSPTEPRRACSEPDGFAARGDDCDDANPAVLPGAPEVCDGVDQDCDGQLDEQPADGATYYLDDDGDGYGGPAAMVVACAQPDGYAVNPDDCDDVDPNVNPDSSDAVLNDVDDDCDGEVDEDYSGAWPLLIVSFASRCDPDDGAFGDHWTYDLVASGANSGGLVIVDQDTMTPWHEEHDLTGAGVELTVSLAGTDLPGQQANLSSLFQCGMQDLMVWRYELYDPSNGLVDCVVASGSATDPSSVWGADFGGCADGNSW